MASKSGSLLTLGIEHIEEEAEREWSVVGDTEREQGVGKSEPG